MLRSLGARNVLADSLLWLMQRPIWEVGLGLLTSHAKKLLLYLEALVRRQVPSNSPQTNSTISSRGLEFIFHCLLPFPNREACECWTRHLGMSFLYLVSPLLLEVEFRTVCSREKPGKSFSSYPREEETQTHRRGKPKIT